MTFYLTFYSILFIPILVVISFTESIQCSKKCTFQELQLNSSIPSDFCLSSTESNNDTNQNQGCKVMLTIDFNTGLVNGSFNIQEESIPLENKISITTRFSLTDTLIKIDIVYTCYTFDYCDLEFVRRTLSPALAAMQMESFRQKLATRLYDPNNTNPVQCSNDSLCPQNTSFCISTYMHTKRTSSNRELVGNRCGNPTKSLEVQWIQIYLSSSIYYETEYGIYYCNIPNCGSNATIIENFQWLSREYILPLDISVVNLTTTPQSTTVTTMSSTKTSTISTTKPNDALRIFAHFNIIVSCFLIILLLNQSFSHIY